LKDAEKAVAIANETLVGGYKNQGCKEKHTRCLTTIGKQRTCWFLTV